MSELQNKQGYAAHIEKIADDLLGFVSMEVPSECEYCVSQINDTVKSLFAYAGQRERVDRAGWCTATGEMVHGGRGRGAHDRHARLFYSVMPLSLRIESPSILIV